MEEKSASSLPKRVVRTITLTQEDLSLLDGIERVIVENVKKSIDCIRKDSPLLLEMEINNEIKIVGAVYDVSSGHVKLL